MNPDNFSSNHDLFWFYMLSQKYDDLICLYSWIKFHFAIFSLSIHLLAGIETSCISTIVNDREMNMDVKISLRNVDIEPVCFMYMNDLLECVYMGFFDI